MALTNLHTWLGEEQNRTDHNLSSRFKVFALLLTQILLSFSILWRYGVEEQSGLTQLLPIFALGTIVHYWLPARAKSVWLTLLSWICIVYALGLISGAFTIAVIAIFFLVAHLQISKMLRTATLVAMVLGMALIRIQVAYMPNALIAVPIIATILMFRFILYIYEIRHEKNQIPIWDRLSYFFNPVNLAFPLFPIIDYKTWIKKNEFENNSAVYATSTRRIFLGILQLLLYRWLYLNIPSADTISTAGELLIYMLAGYLLVLRMLGIFWIAIGIIGYFGIALPPVFDNVFLVTHFSDIWRRINIYWRDFVTKVFYFEIYFKLRKRIKRAILVSSLFVFAITWSLHAWQWFWLRGDSNIKTTDILYWLILGSLIAMQLAREEKKKIIVGSETWADALKYVLRVASMFTFLSFLWMLWQSPTLGEFLFLLSRFSSAPATLLPIIALMTGIVIVGILVRKVLQQKPTESEPSTAKTILICGTITILLHGLYILSEQQQLSPTTSGIIEEIKTSRLNQSDRESAEQGYYEMLVDANDNPWEQKSRVKGRGQWFSSSECPVDDIRKRVLYPSIHLENGKSTFTTNKWGMRSPACELLAPEHTLRIAILGGSYEMGSGVSDEEVFMRIVESKLNDSLKTAQSTVRVEVLNFSTGAYQLPQYVFLCDSTIFKFNPNVVLMFSHSNELQRLNSVISGLVKNGIDLHYDTLKDIKARAGVKQSMSRNEIKNRLQPENLRVAKWCYRHIAQTCSKRKIPAYWVYLPTLTDDFRPDEVKLLSAFTRNIGFRCLVLSTVYKGLDQKSLQISDEDYHPNSKGHEVIANAIYTRIGSDPSFLQLLDQRK